MTSTSAQTYLDRLTNLLLVHADRRRSTAAQNDKSTQFECLAIRVPVLKEVATKGFDLGHLSPEEQLAVYDYIWKNAKYYEVMSIPLLYFRMRFSRVEAFQFNTLKTWIERIDNWGHSDDLAVTYSYFNHKFPNLVFPFLAEMNRRPELWRRRVSIVSLIHYSGKGAVYMPPDEAFPLLDRHLGESNKYIANAVGWVLREYTKKYPELTRDYINANRSRMSALALRRSKVRS